MASNSSPVPDMPRITTDADALPMLKADMAVLCDDVLSVLRKEVGKSNLVVDTIRLSRKNSPEDDWDELIFRVNVDSDAENALALWESLGKAISNLRPSLSREKQRLLDEKIGIFVEW